MKSGPQLVSDDDGNQVLIWKVQLFDIQVRLKIKNKNVATLTTCQNQTCTISLTIAAQTNNNKQNQLTEPPRPSSRRQHLTHYSRRCINARAVCTFRAANISLVSNRRGPESLTSTSQGDSLTSFEGDLSEGTTSTLLLIEVM